jgi:hypothetical protein
MAKTCPYLLDIFPSPFSATKRISEERLIKGVRIDVIPAIGIEPISV